MLTDDKIAGGLLGLLIGDALGVPYEFKAPEQIPRVVDMTPPSDFARSHAGVPVGTWSDDGAMALALLDGLMSAGEYDEGVVTDRFVGWLRAGRYTPDGRVFDVGLQTRRALEIRAIDKNRVFEPPRDERSQGNGSLMRALPLALWHKGSDAELVRIASKQSWITHWHPVPAVACQVYCLWARALLEGHARSTAFMLAFDRLGRIEASEDETAAVRTIVQTKTPRAGTGFVIDSLWSAKTAVDSTQDFASAVRRAVAFGNDTDTTACIAGGIAGLIYGRSGIPDRWINALRGRDVYQPLLEDLIAWRL